MSERESPQAKAWAGQFGRDYTDRNEATLTEMEAAHVELYGVARTVLNRQFLDDLPRTISILEIGCGIGNQLLCLQAMGFRDLTGIDVQPYALERAKMRTNGIAFHTGTILDLAFPERTFDLVFTNNVLIHVHPFNIFQAMSEIVRVTIRYIWGMEYYAPYYVPVRYRGQSDLLWKADFYRLYAALFNVRPLSGRILYRTDGLLDSMYLLEKP